MNVDKFGRYLKHQHINEQIHTHIRTVQKPWQPITLLNDRIKRHLNYTLNNLYGYITLYLTVGPQKQANTNFLEFSTGGYEYTIHFEKCSLLDVKSNVPFKEVIIYNNNKILSIPFKPFTKGDKISIKETVAHNKPILLFLLIKYKLEYL